jgi:hypothetical protein
MAVAEPTLGWVELADLAAYTAAAAALPTGVPQPPPITTALTGTGLAYSTAPGARRVTVQVAAPDSTSAPADRPQIDGTAVVAGAGSFVYARPGVAVAVTTHAADNDLVIVEEF